MSRAVLLPACAPPIPQLMLNNSHFATLIQEQAAKYGETQVMSYRDYDLNKWIPISWNTFLEKQILMSRALLAHGVEVQERVGVFSQNKPECLFVDFGAYAIRAITIPFFATSSAAQVAYMINDAEVRYVFVGEQQQYDTMMALGDSCPTLKKIIIFDPKVVRAKDDMRSVYLHQVLAVTNPSFDAERKKRQETAEEKDIANIL